MEKKFLTVLIYLSYAGLLMSVVGAVFVEFDLSPVIGNKPTYSSVTAYAVISIAASALLRLLIDEVERDKKN
jgi:hypothetical protein